MITLTQERILLSTNSEREAKIRIGSSELEDLLTGLHRTFKGFGFKTDFHPAILYKMHTSEVEGLIRGLLFKESSYFQSLPYSYQHVLSLIELPAGFHNFLQLKKKQKEIENKAFHKDFELPPLTVFSLTENDEVEAVGLEEYIAKTCYRYASEEEAEIYRLCQDVKEKLLRIQQISSTTSLLPKSGSALLERPVFSANPEGKIIFNKTAIKA